LTTKGYIFLVSENIGLNFTKDPNAYGYFGVFFDDKEAQ